MRPIAHGAYFQALEEVAEAALEMCGWLDQFKGDFQEGLVSGYGFRDEAWRAHEKLHLALGPYQRMKYGEGNQ